MKATALLLPMLLAATIAAADEPSKPTPPAELTAPAADAKHSVTGLFTKQLSPGTGQAMPNESDLVKLRYTIWTSEGKLLDSIPPPKVALVPLSKMMPGIHEALLGMSEGERLRVWISETLGAMGRVPKGGMLVADLELVEIVHPPMKPSDVFGPPEESIKTRSGLAYKVIRPGKGTKHPKDGDYVRVNYSGWTTDGNLFDSTVLRGGPSEFGLDQIIAGWREGLKLMTEGEIVRMWIPAKLAYDRQPGKPQGMLVFDVELVDIE